MTKRIRLLKAVRNHLEVELIRNIQQWHYTKVNQQVQRIAVLSKRIPVVQMPAPRISSQRKLFI